VAVGTGERLGNRACTTLEFLLYIKRAAHSAAWLVAVANRPMVVTELP